MSESYHIIPNLDQSNICYVSVIAVCACLEQASETRKFWFPGECICLCGNPLWILSKSYLLDASARLDCKFFMNETNDRSTTMDDRFAFEWSSSAEQAILLPGSALEQWQTPVHLQRRTPQTIIVQFVQSPFFKFLFWLVQHSMQRHTVAAPTKHKPTAICMSFSGKAELWFLRIPHSNMVSWGLKLLWKFQGCGMSCPQLTIINISQKNRCRN